MFFAGVTGAASADTASVGSVLIPGMVKKGYSPAFSTAVTITSSTIGVIIPPSIPMVIYGVLTDASVAEMFIAGAVPGVLIGLALIAISYVISWRRGYPIEPFLGWKRTVISFFEGLPPLTVIVIIFGGIIGGIFTPTEAAVIAAIYSLVLSLVFYRTLSLRDLPDIFVETATISSLAALLIAASNVFSWLLTTQQVPVLLSEHLLSLTDNPFVVLLLITAIYLVIGTVIDLTPAMIILVPIFLPLVQTLGVDVIHFGIITVMALAIGLYTPPVGTCLAVGLAIGNVSIVQITRALAPFFVVMLLVLLLIVAFPVIPLYLVNVFR
jgi:C4-dicarboxylate transporter DctM subunit